MMVHVCSGPRSGICCGTPYERGYHNAMFLVQQLFNLHSLTPSRGTLAAFFPIICLIQKKLTLEHNNVSLHKQHTNVIFLLYTLNRIRGRGYTLRVVYWNDEVSATGLQIALVCSPILNFLVGTMDFLKKSTKIHVCLSVVEDCNEISICNIRVSPNNTSSRFTTRNEHCGAGEGRQYLH